GVKGEAGVQVDAFGVGGVVEEAQPGGGLEGGEVEAGGVVDEQDAVQVPRQGERGLDQGGQQGAGGGGRVVEEAVGGLAVGPGGEGKGEGEVGVVLQAAEDKAQTPAQPWVGDRGRVEVSCQDVAAGGSVGGHGYTR